MRCGSSLDRRRNRSRAFWATQRSVSAKKGGKKKRCIELTGARAKCPGPLDQDGKERTSGTVAMSGLTPDALGVVHVLAVHQQSGSVAGYGRLGVGTPRTPWNRIMSMRAEQRHVQTHLWRNLRDARVHGCEFGLADRIPREDASARLPDWGELRQGSLYGGVRVCGTFL